MDLICAPLAPLRAERHLLLQTRRALLHFYSDFIATSAQGNQKNPADVVIAGLLREISCFGSCRVRVNLASDILWVSLRSENKTGCASHHVTTLILHHEVGVNTVPARAVKPFSFALKKLTPVSFSGAAQDAKVSKRSLFLKL